MSIKRVLIGSREKLKIPANVIDQLINGAQSDIRQVLNMLSIWKLSNDSMDFDEGKNLWVPSLRLEHWFLCELIEPSWMRSIPFWVLSISHHDCWVLMCFRQLQERHWVIKWSTIFKIIHSYLFSFRFVHISYMSWSSGLRVVCRRIIWSHSQQSSRTWMDLKDNWENCNLWTEQRRRFPTGI